MIGLEVWLASELEGRRVEDAFVGDGGIVGLEKPAGRVAPLLPAHVAGSNSLGQHRPSKRQ